MLQISPVSSNSDVPNVFTREFGIDPLDNELKPDEGRKTLISLKYLYKAKFEPIMCILIYCGFFAPF